MNYVYLRYKLDTHQYYIGETSNFQQRNNQFYNRKSNYGGGSLLEEARISDWDENLRKIKKDTWEWFLLYIGLKDSKLLEKRCIQIIFDLFERNKKTGILLNKTGFSLSKTSILIPKDWQEFVNQNIENKILLSKTPSSVANICRLYGTQYDGEEHGVDG